MHYQKQGLDQAIAAYFTSEPTYCEPYGNGHINDTYLVICGKRFILQRINTGIFTKPVQLMENIVNVTKHIRNKVKVQGGDVSRCTLMVLKTIDNEDYYRDSYDGYWRLYEFTENTVTLENVQSAEQFYKCGKAFGEFQQMLADYPAAELHAVLPDLHNTPKRYENLMYAAQQDICGRRCEVLEELAFVAQRKEFCNILEDAHRRGCLPLHVTHNDTKLNNILFDEKTGDPVCAIDLDTVMPGYAITDFGDSIRSGANTAGEGVVDLTQVRLDLTLFSAYAKGFLEGCNGSLTEGEIDLLACSAAVITLECGMRFLTDYLSGDTYFKIHYPSQNLDRARTQFALLRDMEAKLADMKEIINSLRK
jgi:hypothetical protein